jgi:hypothetical protein
MVVLAPALAALFLVLLGIQWALGQRRLALLRAEVQALAATNRCLLEQNRALIAALGAHGGPGHGQGPVPEVAAGEPGADGYCPTCGAAFGLYGTCVCK